MFELSKSKHPDLARLYGQANAIYENLPAVKRARRRAVMITIFKTGAAVCLVILAVAAIFVLYHLAALRTIISGTVAGKDNLQAAANHIRSEDFAPAAVAASSAEKNFREVGEALAGLNRAGAARRIGAVRQEIDNLQYLAKTGEMLARTASLGAEFGLELKGLIEPEKKLTYSKLSPEEKKRILGKIYQSAPELAGIKANLDLASANLAQVRFTGPFFLLSGKIIELKNMLSVGSEMLDRAIPLSQIIPALSGYPEKSTFLVMLENSDELRPTGGFLGTYGILEIEYGDISRFETHDIYHLDMPVKDKVNIEPPAPLKAYLNPKWYMRDANWSPDWPESARQLEFFYNLENSLLPPKDQINNFSGQFAGVIAITPKFVTDLLSLTGPIRLGDEAYTENNFTDLLQYKVEKGYMILGVPSWRRKEVIGDILRELKIRLLDLPASSWQSVAKIIDNNLQKKNILIYHRDPAVEGLLKAQGWAGELKPARGDYLLLVDANMASLKTDAVISRAIQYELSERPGGLFAKLSVSYAHRGEVDWKTSAYKDYVRVYAPRGAKLIRAGGALRTAVETGEEQNKTFFGVLINIAPGEIGRLELEYKLPDFIYDDLKRTGDYRLLVEKQPGSRVEELTVDLAPASDIKSYDPVGFSASRPGSRQVRWQTDLETAKEFSINISK